ncbi:hypothetical protein V8C34DRAFT_295680 [Trichoderma compactum]
MVLKLKAVNYDIYTDKLSDRLDQSNETWFYRMNEHIPLWDRDGRLIFNNDNDLKPKCFSLKN